MTNNITNDIRELPIYQAAYSDGLDVGLAFALTALTVERGRQDQQAASTDSHTPEAARHAFATATLLDVSKVVAAKFRQ